MNTNAEQFFIDPVQKEMEVAYVTKFRTIPLYDEVTRESIFKCLYWLEKLVTLDKKEGVKRPITLQIDSYGGYCYHGLSLISRIESLIDDGYEIIGVCAGVAMSMGSAILNACSVRKMYRYGTILIHQVSSGSHGEIKKMEEELEESKRLWTVLKDLYLKRTNISEDKLDEVYRCKLDWVLDSKQALELGVVDEVI